MSSSNTKYARQVLYSFSKSLVHELGVILNCLVLRSEKIWRGGVNGGGGHIPYLSQIRCPYVSER